VPGAETFRASADAYDRHICRYAPQLASALIGFARIEPGMRALDVGCGPGALTAALADRLGTANVHAADPSEPFVEACRERLPGVPFRLQATALGRYLLYRPDRNMPSAGALDLLAPTETPAPQRLRGGLA
jgi:trans-aconitate methyltransferase